MKLDGHPSNVHTDGRIAITAAQTVSILEPPGDEIDPFVRYEINMPKDNFPPPDIGVVGATVSASCRHELTWSNRCQR